METITYNIMQHIVGRTWHKIYENLNESDMRIVAGGHFKIKKEKVDKLVNHKNKKFNCYSAKGISIDKIFHDEPVETVEYSVQQTKRINEQLARANMKDDYQDKC